MIVAKNVFDRVMQKSSVCVDEATDILGRSVQIHNNADLEEIGGAAVNADGSVEYTLCGTAEEAYQRSRAAAKANGWIL